ncbi:ester cyclase [Kitasatospora sp. A2-31]|uniref:ester cyclase n=1 Tax=Kitasatospora sp. A2-31 TaxID=2916414 RepID=UPI001EE9BA8E|nr:ester cyclase [Kitasatospora sp. A2-31]MCG6493944.1 ester cyclase [Kitasatospora sp. A2-31]
MAMSAEDAARGLFTVLATGDGTLAAAVVHEDFTNREAVVSPAASSLPGPAGVLASGAWLRSAFSDLRFPVTDLAHDGDQVWIRLHMQGRHTGPFVHYRDGELLQAIPPTGAEIDSEQVHVLHLRDGKVVRHEAVRDDLALLGQLGIVPPGPTAQSIRDWHDSGHAARAATQIAEAAERAAATAR